MTTAHSQTSEAVAPHGMGMAPKIEWFEGPREELSDLFALADDSATAVATYRALGRVLVARDGPTVIGHLQLVAGDSQDEAEVKSLAVREDRQGAGVGRSLVERAAAACREEHRSTLLVATAAADTRASCASISCSASGCCAWSATRSRPRPAIRRSWSTAFHCEIASGCRSR